MRTYTSTALVILCLVGASGCGGGGGDSDSDDGDAVVVAPTPSPTPIVVSCADNTASCDQGESTISDAEDAGVEDARFVDTGSGAKECTIIICSTNVNVGDTSVTNTTTTTSTTVPDRWAGVASVEVIR